MTTSLDTLIVPVRYYSALDPYNWKVDNRPLSDLEDNDDVLRSGIETCLNAAKVGAAVDGRLLKALVGPYNAVGYWEPSASGVALEIYNTIKVSTVTDDSHDVDLIAIQYSPAVFALPTPSSGNKVLATIYAKYQIPSTPEMPYYDPTQGLDALGTTVGTLQTKQGNIEFAIATVVVADTDPDNYPSPAVGYDTLFNIKVDSTDTVLNPDKIIAVGISTLGQAIAKATKTSYGQVRFATTTEVTTGTSTSTVVSPADVNSIIPIVGDTRYLRYITIGEPSELLQIFYGIGNFKALSGNISVVYSYTTDNTFLSMDVSVFSGGGGGGAAGGTHNNGNLDLGSAGGAGGGSGCGVRTTLVGLRVGTIITIELGAAGTGGTYAYDPGNPGVPSSPSMLKVTDPNDGIILKVSLPGGKGGAGSVRGGINSCTAPGATTAVTPAVLAASLFPMSLVNGGVGQQGFCSGGSSGGSGGSGGVLSEPHVISGAVPALGGAGSGLPGNDAFTMPFLPFSLSKGGGGGGGAPAGQNTGGRGGDPAPAGYIIRLRTRNYA